jgi:hypothetical protein
MLPLKDYIQKPSLVMLGLLRGLNFLFPDKLYLKLLYRLKLGRKLDLKTPKRFTEKLQWLKLYDRKPEYTKMVDKIAVKEYVEGVIGDQFIIPTLGTWYHFDDIDFDSLPNQFVLKTNHGGGGCAVVICRDKNKFDKARAKGILEHSLNHSIYPNLREWPYKNIKPMILAEELLECETATDIPDYKWYCFNGVPKYCQIIQSRSTKETIDFFDTNWVHQEFVGLNPAFGEHFKMAEIVPARPTNLELHIQIAERLSLNIPFSRIDLYDIGGKVYFGEITFYPMSGLGCFEPEVFDVQLGNMINLLNVNNNK